MSDNGRLLSTLRISFTGDLQAVWTFSLELLIRVERGVLADFVQLSCCFLI